MNKKVTIEFTQEEYDTIIKIWDQAKKSPIMPSKALNFDDFCKEIIIMFTKGPDLNNLKDMNLDDLMGQMGDLSQFKEMIESMTNKKSEVKKEEKKEDLPDDQKYKS